VRGNETPTLQGVTAASSGTHPLVQEAGVDPGALWRARLRVREATGGEPQRYRRGLRDETRVSRCPTC